MIQFLLIIYFFILLLTVIFELKRRPKVKDKDKNDAPNPLNISIKEAKTSSTQSSSPSRLGSLFNYQDYTQLSNRPSYQNLSYKDDLVQDVLKVAYNHHLSHKTVSRMLNVTYGTAYNWSRKYRSASGDMPDIQSLLEDNAAAIDHMKSIYPSLEPVWKAFERFVLDHNPLPSSHNYFPATSTQLNPSTDLNVNSVFIAEANFRIQKDTLDPTGSTLANSRQTIDQRYIVAITSKGIINLDRINSSINALSLDGTDTKSVMSFLQSTINQLKEQAPQEIKHVVLPLSISCLKQVRQMVIDSSYLPIVFVGYPPKSNPAQHFWNFVRAKVHGYKKRANNDSIDKFIVKACKKIKSKNLKRFFTDAEKIRNDFILDVYKE